MKKLLCNLLPKAIVLLGTLCVLAFLWTCTPGGGGHLTLSTRWLPSGWPAREHFLMALVGPARGCRRV